MNDTPKATKLDPAYDSALLGASITHPQQFVYSLRKLVRIEMMRGGINASSAREEVFREFIAPYSQEIFFLNDELLDPISDVEKPCIITPSQFRK